MGSEEGVRTLLSHFMSALGGEEDGFIHQHMNYKSRKNDLKLPMMCCLLESEFLLENPVEMPITN